MECINIEFDTPAENIAFDELLLAQAECGQRHKTLRFWEIKNYVVVLGKGRSVADDVFIDRCKKDNIKIIQRISGGGTVLLGKGCLNYSLLLPYDSSKELLNIRSSFKFILERLVAGFKGLNLNIKFHPVSDLALDDKKISGNAQARKKKFLLHHGTFLYDFDIERVNFYLKEPQKYPQYRDNRTHKDFLTNIPYSYTELKEMIKDSLASL